MGGALLFAALAVGAPALKDKDPTGLVGEWVLAGGTVDGKDSPPQGPPGRWVFRADGTWEIRVDGKRQYGGTYTTDPAARPPALDLGVRGTDLVHLSIYRVAGDRLTVIQGWPGAARPAGFEAPKGARQTLMEFARVKK